MGLHIQKLQKNSESPSLRWRARQLALIGLICSVLSGCGGLRFKNAEIDPSLLSCQEEPIVPPAPILNQVGAQYVNDLQYAGEDCRSKLGQVRQVVEETR